MEKCVKCGADTILRVNGVPLCVDCDKQRSTDHLTHRPAQREEREPPPQQNNQSRKAAG